MIPRPLVPLLSCSRRFQIPADGAKRREKAVYGIGDDAFDITVAPRAVIFATLIEYGEKVWRQIVHHGVPRDVPPPDREDVPAGKSPAGGRVNRCAALTGEPDKMGFLDVGRGISPY